MSILSSLLKLGQGQPTSQVPQVVQTTEIAKEVAPFIKDILGKGQALYKQRMDEGYVPYAGQTLAEMSPDQLAAEEGLRGLVGSQTADFAEARGLTRGQTDAPTLENLQPFMNPYQQAVTDIAKRQATEQFQQTTLPTLRKRAVDAGSFGGSRAAMLESQAQDNQARLLADLQSKGDLAGFQNAQTAFADQKERERLAAQGLTSLSGLEDAATRKELSGIQAVGVTQQKREQQLLDESYKKFLDERRFPEQQLGQYQAFTAGASPFLGKTSTTMADQSYNPSPIEKALKFGTAAIGTGLEAKKLFGKAGGLIDLPVVQKQEGQQVLNLRKDYDEPGFVSQGERIAEKVQNLPGDIKDFLGSILGPNEKQKQQSVERDAQITRMKSNKDFAESGRPGLDEFKEQQDTYTTLRSALDTEIPSDARVPDVNISNQKEADKTNSETDNDAIGGDKKGDVSSDVKTGLPDMREALVKKEGLFSDLDKSLTERMNARLANIKSSKEAAKAQAQIDFLMGFSKGKRDPKDGSFLGGLTAMGQGAVAATADFNNQIAKLDSQELDVLDANIQDKFNIESEKLNLAFKNGEITRQEFNDMLAERKVVAQELLAGKNAAATSLQTLQSLYDDLENQKITSGKFESLKQQYIKEGIILPRHSNLSATKLNENLGENDSKLIDANSDDIRKKEITVD